MINNPEVGKFANLYSFRSDGTSVTPFEILRVGNNGRTLEVRGLKASFVPGSYIPQPVIAGFVGTNVVRKQYSYTIDDDAPRFLVRKQADGSWKSKLGRHNIDSRPNMHVETYCRGQA